MDPDYPELGGGGGSGGGGGHGSRRHHYYHGSGHHHQRHGHSHGSHRERREHARRLAAYERDLYDEEEGEGEYAFPERSHRVPPPAPEPVERSRDYHHRRSSHSSDSSSRGYRDYPPSHPPRASPPPPPVQAKGYHPHHHPGERRGGEYGGDKQRGYRPPSPPPPDIVPSTDVIHQPQPPPTRPRNYKLLMDPFLIKGCTKLYRYEGIVPNDPTYPPVVVKDPRSPLSKGLWTKLEPLDLPVPQFKIDSNYVGIPPAVEVTISNLNDNIDKSFLFDMVHKFGAIEDLRILYHPLSNKHLGLGRVVFKAVGAAAACVEKLAHTSVMGKVLRVNLDAFGKECTQMFEELTATKKPDPPPPAPELSEEPKAAPDTAPPPPAAATKRDDPAPITAKPGEDPYYSHHHSGGSSTRPEELPPAPPPPSSSYPPTSYHHPYPPPPLHPSPMAPPWFAAAAQSSHPPHPHPHPPTPPATEPPPLPPPPPHWERRGGGNEEEEREGEKRSLEEEEEERGNQLDLDTRIEMLLRGNKISVGGIPISSEESDEDFTTGGGSGAGAKHHHHRKSHRRPSWNAAAADTLPLGADEEDATAPTTPEGPLSTPPSPFLSEEIYLNCFKRAIEMALEAREREEREAKGFLENVEGFKDDLHSEISSTSEDEALGRSVTQEIRAALNYSAAHQGDPGGDQDDRMSLSSLSSGDEKIQEQLPPAPGPATAVPQGLPLGPPHLHMAPPHLAHLYGPYPPAPFWSHHQAPHPGAFMFHPGAPLHGQQLLKPRISSFIAYPVPSDFSIRTFKVPPMGLPLHHGGSMGPSIPSVVVPVQPAPADPSQSPQVQITNVLVERLSRELKQILKRDINKKMVESIAYQALETWWDQELKRLSEPDSLDGGGAGGGGQKTSSSLAVDNSFALGGFGLGFRATLPKMPSFRMKRKAPLPGKLSPKSKRARKSTEDASSSSSEEEGLIKGSDDELDTGREPGALSPPSPHRRGAPSPASSKYSSSSGEEDLSSSSSEESEEEEETLVDSDTATVAAPDKETSVSDEDLPIAHVLSKKRADSSRKPPRASTVYTPSEDSESDLELAKAHKQEVDRSKAFDSTTNQSTPSRKGKFIYSSSSDEEAGKEAKKSVDKETNKSVKEKKPTESLKELSVVLDRMEPDKATGKVEEKKREERVPTPTHVDEEKEDGEIEDDRSSRGGRSVTPIPPSSPPATTTPVPSLPPTPGRGTLSSADDEEEDNLSLAVRTKRLTKKPRLQTPPTPDIQPLGEAEATSPPPVLDFVKSPSPVSSEFAALFDHSYCRPKSSPGGGDGEARALSPAAHITAHDHAYTFGPPPPDAARPRPQLKAQAKHRRGSVEDKENKKERRAEEKERRAEEKERRAEEKERRRKEKEREKAQRLAEKLEKKEERRKERERGVRSSYQPRDVKTEMDLLFSFLTRGIDAEDISFIRRSYQAMLGDDTLGFWLHETHWVDHPVTDLPDPAARAPDRKKKRAGGGADDLHVHATGCARTEGFYKIDSRQKAQHKYHFGQTIVQQIERAAAEAESATPSSAAANLKVKLTSASSSISREARSNQRRLLTAFGTATDSDLLKFNILKFRKKQLRFAKSAIHDWGLFAMEPIAADEMVIEYVGQMIRPSVADLRERQYEAIGIGSSYLFRIDLDTIIDATRCGNLARFINHSCNPNCYAKIITIDSQKKIVIYSKQAISVNEEITYDYKFPLEDDKISCLCGAQGCRGFLN